MLLVTSIAMIDQSLRRGETCDYRSIAGRQHPFFKMRTDFKQRNKLAILSHARIFTTRSILISHFRAARQMDARIQHATSFSGSPRRISRPIESRFRAKAAARRRRRASWRERKSGISEL